MAAYDQWLKVETFHLECSLEYGLSLSFSVENGLIYERN